MVDNQKCLWALHAREVHELIDSKKDASRRRVFSPMGSQYWNRHSPVIFDPACLQRKDCSQISPALSEKLEESSTCARGPRAKLMEHKVGKRAMAELRHRRYITKTALSGDAHSGEAVCRCSAARRLKVSR